MLVKAPFIMIIKFWTKWWRHTITSALTRCWYQAKSEWCIGCQQVGGSGRRLHPDAGGCVREVWRLLLHHPRPHHRWRSRYHFRWVYIPSGQEMWPVTTTLIKQDPNPTSHNPYPTQIVIFTLPCMNHNPIMITRAKRVRRIIFMTLSQKVIF